jgi:hypothetical protein
MTPRGRFVAHTLSDSEWFGTKVLATATSTADLQATTPLFGAPGTTYPTGTGQGPGVRRPR